MTTLSEKWSCKEGCDLSGGVICPHLEKLLPKPNLYNRRYEEKRLDPLLVTDQETQDALLYHMGPEREQEFTAFLEDHGCAEFEVEVLVALFIEKLTLREIRKLWGFSTVSAVVHVYQMATKKIINCISWRKKNNGR